MGGPKTFRSWFVHTDKVVLPAAIPAKESRPVRPRQDDFELPATVYSKYHDSSFRVGLGLPTRIPKEERRHLNLLAQDVNVPGRRTMQTSVSRLGLPVKWTGIPEEITLRTSFTCLRIAAVPDLRGVEPHSPALGLLHLPGLHLHGQTLLRGADFQSPRNHRCRYSLRSYSTIAILVTYTIGRDDNPRIMSSSNIVASFHKSQRNPWIRISASPLFVNPIRPTPNNLQEALVNQTRCRPQHICLQWYPLELVLALPEPQDCALHGQETRLETMNPKDHPNSSKLNMQLIKIPRGTTITGWWFPTRSTHVRPDSYTGRRHHRGRRIAPPCGRFPHLSDSSLPIRPKPG